MKSTNKLCNYKWRNRQENKICENCGIKTPLENKRAKSARNIHHLSKTSQGWDEKETVS